jgi:hypothetical protein
MSDVVVERIPKKSRPPTEPGTLIPPDKVDPPTAAVSQVPTPTVGRIVHYHGMPGERRNGEEWHAAIVTGGTGLRVNLRVFFDNGPIEYRESIEHESAAKTQRCWRWPPRS